MGWDEIGKIVLGILASIGGISAVILACIKFSVNIIAKRLEERYTLKLNKELEKYKSNLDNKTYISKTKFEAEFKIYRELTKAFFEMVKDVSIMIPAGIASYPADKEKREKYENNLYSNASKTTVIAQEVLNSNIPFIPSDLYEKYNEILGDCKVQLGVFEDSRNDLYRSLPDEKEGFSSEDYKLSREILKKFNILNESIREYLSKLDVLE